MKSFVIFSIVLVAVSFATSPIEGDNSQHVNLLSRKGPNFRIVGGRIATPKQFPYHVKLTLMKIKEGQARPTISSCSGALISNQTILTAAHCLAGAINGGVSLGSAKTSSNESTRLNLAVFKKNFIIHEGYNSTSQENDIGLISLDFPVKFNDAIQIINLPPASLTNLDHHMGIISGFGKTGTNATDSFELRFAFRRILPNEDCQKPYPKYFKPEMHVCADGSNKTSTCRGDSGGPLVIVQDDGSKVLVGLTSFASVSCEAGYPTVSIRVTNYLSWIQKYMGVLIRD